MRFFRRIFPAGREFRGGIGSLRRLCYTAAALLLAALPFAADAADGRIVVASKIDTEGALLGNMIVSLLEARGLAVDNKLQLGPTNIVRAAILAGQIDIYPEYTGNGALFFHLEADPVWKDWALGAAKVAALDREKNHLVWLAAAPANNTWVIAVRRDLARAPRPQDNGRLGELPRGGRAHQARRLGRVRRKPVGLAGLRGDLRLPALRRAVADPVGRQYLGHVARRGRGDVRGQRRNGVRHRWRYRRARPRRTRG